MTETIGQILQRTRKGKRLSLQTVSSTLHIKAAYLQALEEDRPEDLPSPVQGRGFLRLYADLLEIDLASIDNKHPSPTEESSEPPSSGSATEDGSFSDSNLAQTPESVFEPVDIIPGSQVKLKFIGSQLRKQRQSLNLTLEQIEAITHLNTFYIAALEDGRLDSLPSPVQARGMLANYATFLDLDVDQVLLDFADALQIRRIEQQPPVSQSPNKLRLASPKSLTRTLLSWETAIISLFSFVILASLILGASSILSFQRSPSITLTAIANMTQAALFAEETRAAELPIEPTAVLTASPDTSMTTLPAEQATSGVTVTLLPQSPKPVQVFVIAKQRTFVKVLVDGKTAYNDRVVPGNPYEFSAKERIEISCGNAGAIQIVYNQTDLGILGAIGEPVYLIFSLEAYGTPTLTPSSTPTVTLKPTRTPIPSNTYPPTRTPRPSATPKPTSTPKPSPTAAPS